MAKKKPKPLTKDELLAMNQDLIVAMTKIHTAWTVSRETREAIEKAYHLVQEQRETLADHGVPCP